MLNWNNLDTLASYQELEKAERINLAEVMSGACKNLQHPDRGWSDF